MDVTCLHLLFCVILKVQFIGFGDIWQGDWPPCRGSRRLFCPSCTTVTAWGCNMAASEKEELLPLYLYKTHSQVQEHNS